MKNTKLIALTLVVAMMLVGAGYAAWTDKIQTKTIVNTGELEVEIVGEPEIELVRIFKSDDVKDMNLWDSFDGEVDIKEGTATYNIFNMYPGTEARTALAYANTGTLTAFINDVDVSYSMTEANKKLRDAIRVDYDFQILSGETVVATIEAKDIALGGLAAALRSGLVGHYLQEGEQIGQVTLMGHGHRGHNGGNGNNNNCPGGNCNPGGNDPIPEPGPEEGKYNLTFKLPADSLNGDDGELENVTVDITIHFVQHNMFSGDVKTRIH